MSGTLSYTYNTLIAAIQTWAEDDSDELVAAIPEVVARGESKLITDLNLEIFDRVRTGTMTADQYLQAIKTSTWQGTRSLHYTPVGGGARVFLQKRTYEYCVDYSPDESDTGPPIYYAEYSETEFFMSPAPDFAYPFEMREVTRDTAQILTLSNQNTWLATHAGDLLFDACMISAELYIKSEQYDVDKWKSEYQEKMPQRRMELREQIRADYTPIQNAARTVDDRP